MKKVICAGCMGKFLANECYYHRRKRWCGKESCRDIIDDKVKHSNYKKKVQKIKNGTWRSGVDQDEREFIVNRDGHRCGKCGIFNDSFGVMQVHHIIPVSEGGTDVRSNLITLCKWCHADIHERGWENYAESLRKEVEKVEGADKASRS